MLFIYGPYRQTYRTYRTIAHNMKYKQNICTYTGKWANCGKKWQDKWPSTLVKLQFKIDLKYILSFSWAFRYLHQFERVAVWYFQVKISRLSIMFSLVPLFLPDR